VTERARRLRVLSLVPRPIYPFLSGGEIRVGALMRRLAPDYQFHILSFLERGRELDQAAAAVELERRHGLRSLFCPRTPHVLPVAGKPSIAADYWDPAMVTALREAVTRLRIDLVQIEFTQMAQYAEHVADLAPVVLTEHDSSVIAPTESYFRTGDDGVAHAREARAYLESCFSHCRRVVVVSAADAARLEPLAGPGRLAVVPTGADTERLAFRPLEGRDAANVLFLGHYPHYPNEDAAVYLCREILPRLKRLVPRARATLVGSAPTPAVRALAGPDVEVVGTVPDVAPYLWRMGLFVAPMRRGFGIKGKVLEAFSAGLPVVATPEACEAMPGVADGREILLASGADALAAAAARLLRDRALAARAARAARRYVVARFDWGRQARLLDRVLRGALAPARARVSVSRRKRSR